MHILEPLISFQDLLKAKPMMNAIKPPQAEALALMSKAADKKKLSGTPAAGDQAPAKDPTPKDDEFIRPTLNLTLKLEVSKVPLAKRPSV